MHCHVVRLAYYYVGFFVFIQGKPEKKKSPNQAQMPSCLVIFFSVRRAGLARWVAFLHATEMLPCGG